MDRQYPAIFAAITSWVIIGWIYLIFGWQLLASMAIVLVGASIVILGMDAVRAVSRKR